MICLLLAYIFKTYASCCYQCDSVSGQGNCQSCISGNVLQGYVCMDQCASGYTDSASVCSESGDLCLISTDFSSDKTYTSTVIGEFSASGSSFYDLPNMIPTFDRGFYSSSSNYLISTDSFAIAPDFSFKLYFLPLNSGTIFSVPSLFDLTISDTALTFTVSLYDQTSSSTVNKELSVTISANSWLNIVFYVSQDSGSDVTLNVVVGDLATSQSFTNVEAAKISSNFVYIGNTDGTTAEGFYYNVELWNGISSTALSTSELNTCEFFQYFDGEYCENCDSSCDSRVNCWTGNICSACAFKQCYPCNGFDSDDCAGCSNGETAPYCCDVYCISCVSLTECSICADGKSLIDGICLEGLPYGLTDYSTEYPVEIISAVFDELQFGDYNGLDCGADSTTFYPFDDGESDDPIPSKSRGVYFNGNSFLQYSELVILSYSFTVSILIRPDDIVDYSILSIADYLYINSMDPIIKLNLLQYTGTSSIQEYSWGGLYADNSWVYLTIVVSVSSTDTWVDFYMNSDLYSSFNSGIFRMPSLTIKLGLGDQSNFSGFIYSVQILQGSSVSLSSPTICSTSSDSDCINDCNYLTYLTASGTCIDCLDSCELGCFTTSCQICDELTCQQCSSFLNSDCTLCANGYFLNNGICESCDSSCKTCSGSGNNNCLTCYSDLEIKNGVCVDSCRTACYSTCETCDLCSFIGCSSCKTGYYELFGTCSKCPTGYKVIDNECILAFELVFDLKFDSLNGIVNDTACGMLGVTGSTEQFYPDFEKNDPIPAFNRGFYFNGKSSVVTMPISKGSDNVFSIAPEFTFEVWLFAQGNDGVIIAKQGIEDNESLFIVYLQNSWLYVEARLSNDSISVIDMPEIELNEWVYFSVTFKMYTEGDFQLFYNKNNEVSEVPTDEYLLDQFSLTMLNVGAKQLNTNSLTEYFKGFIYQIKFYNKAQSYPVASNSECESGCSICNSDGICLDPCKFGYFLNNTCEKCENCPYGCTSNENNCSFCFDSLCSICSSFESCQNCTEHAYLNDKCECLTGYIQENFTCVLCAEVFDECNLCSSSQCTECLDGYYLDSGSCSSCDDGCKNCNKNQCLKCFENSFMDNQKCVCYEGYEGKSCSFVGFYLDIMFKEDLNFILIFSETLKKDLSYPQLNAYINNEKVPLSLEKWSNTRYIIEFSPESSVENNTLLILQLSSSIESVNNSILPVLSYNLTLPEYQISSNSNWKTYKRAYSIICYIIVPLIILSVLIPENLPTIWNFLNTLQMLSFLYLLNLEYSDLTKGLTIGLRNYAFFPNAFQSISGTSHSISRITTLGYTQNSFIKNCGNFLTILITCLILFIISKTLAFVMHKVRKEKYSKVFDSFCQQYKFSFFCRFLIQSFMEILCMAGVALKSSTMASGFQSFNFALSLIFTVRFI